MSVFTKIFSRVRGIVGKGTIPLNELVKYYGSVVSGEIVNTPEQALSKNSWVFACIRAIVLSGRQVPLRVTDSKGREVDKVKAILRRPNPFMTWGDLIEQTLMWAELRGVAFWYIKYPFIYVLDSDLARLKFNDDGYEVEYFNGKTMVKFTQDEVVYFPNFVLSYQRSTFLPTLTASLSGVQMQSVADSLNKNLLKNGGYIPGFFTTSDRLTDKDIKRFKEIWRNRYSGYENAGEVPIFSKGIQYEKIGLTPSDMLFLEMEKVTRDRISAVFGVPSVLINVIDKVNYSTAREQRRIFWENTLIPKLDRIMERVNVFVIPLIYKGDVEVKLEYQSVSALKEDEEKKVKVQSERLKAGLRTVNEIRVEEGREPLPWGDERWRPAGSDVQLAQLEVLYGYNKESKGLNNGEIEGKGKIIGVSGKKRSKVNIERGGKLHRSRWLRVVKLAESQERRFIKELRDFWKEQRKAIIERLKERYGKMSKGEMAKINVKEFDDLMDMTEEGDRYIRKLYPFYVVFGSQAGDFILADFGVETSFDMSNPAIANELRSMVLDTAFNINQTTRRMISEELAEAVENGESLMDMEERIVRLFSDMDKNRAFTIARTEVLKVDRWAEWEAVRQEDLPVVKVWLSSLDNVVRDGHDVAHGQVVDRDEPFIVNGEELQYPGDPSGSPGNIINCRCVVQYILKEEEVSYE